MRVKSESEVTLYRFDYIKIVVPKMYTYSYLVNGSNDISKFMKKVILHTSYDLISENT